MTRQDEIAARFDRWAPAYDDCALLPMHRAAHQGVLAAAARLGLRPRRILDVGCGTGRLLAAAACVFPDAALAGVDVSRAMLSVARTVRLAGDAVLVQAAVEQLPFGDCSFDLVVSTISFRHWPDQRAGMCEIHRVLTPGAHLILADVFAVRRQSLFTRMTRRALPPPRLVQPALAAAGFGVQTVEYADGFGPVHEIAVVAAQRGLPLPQMSAGTGSLHA